MILNVIVCSFRFTRNDIINALRIFFIAACDYFFSYDKRIHYFL